MPRLTAQLLMPLRIGRGLSLMAKTSNRRSRPNRELLDVSGRSVKFDDFFSSFNEVPRGEIVVIGPGGPSGTSARFTDILIDTGAVHSSFPSDFAPLIGLVPTSGTACLINTPGGRVGAWFLAVDVEFQGVVCPRVGAYFLPPGSMTLIGRSTIYAACKTFGLSEMDWLREAHRSAQATPTVTPVHARSRAKQAILRRLAGSRPRMRQD